MEVAPPLEVFDDGALEGDRSVGFAHALGAVGRDVDQLEVHADGAERAGKQLLAILGADALAICDGIGLLTWTGTGDHHRKDAFEHGADTRASGRVSAVRSISCGDPDCPIRSAVTAPIVSDDRVVGTITAYTTQASPGLARATEEVARWVAR